jgi:cis-3-alkyl-4-acyloxetan-2-one decarboxylase
LLDAGVVVVSAQFDRSLYPFESRYLDRGGNKLHYVDEGAGTPVLMLHGNPTWSFYYRRLIQAVRPHWRAIAPDHIGCGLSDKPGDDKYNYTLESRVDDVEALADHLGLEKLHLVVHDWGGMIGFAFACRKPERIKSLTVLNTAAFLLPPGKGLPASLKLARTKLGPVLVQGFNAFALGAAQFCAKRPLPKEVRKGFLAPYDNWQNRIATLRFVQDIPLEATDPAYGVVAKTMDALPKLAKLPMLIGWGERDFVFDHAFLAEWLRRFPNAELRHFPDAGHYVLEDAADALIPAILGFLEKNS